MNRGARRRIAKSVGVHKDTVRNDLMGIGEISPPAATITGRSGKRWGSTRRIAEAVGVSRTTVVRDIEEGVTNVTPSSNETITGRDGKQYPARVGACQVIKIYHLPRTWHPRARGRTGWSRRRIAAAVKVGKTTVLRDLGSIGPFGPMPDMIEISDGRTYPARRPATTERAGGSSD